MERSPAAIEVHKDETTRLHEALIDRQVVGNLAYETTGGQSRLIDALLSSRRQSVDRVAQGVLAGADVVVQHSGELVV